MNRQTRHPEAAAPAAPAPAEPAAGGRRRAGFTLMELLVIIGIIGLSLGVILPSVYAIVGTKSEAQAEAVMSAALRAARGTAIEAQTYALLHVQPDLEYKRCYAAVFKFYGGGYNKFRPVEGYRPWQMPKNTAFGQVTSEYVLPGAGSDMDTYNSAALTDADQDVSDRKLLDFATFNVVFAPNGSLAEFVNGDVPVLETLNVSLFAPPEGQEEEKLWRNWNDDGVLLDEKGIRMMTVFNYEILRAIEDRAAELNENGRFLAVNPYTGQLIPYE